MTKPAGLTGRRVLVTGGVSGIGAACAVVRQRCVLGPRRWLDGAVTGQAPGPA